MANPAHSAHIPGEQNQSEDGVHIAPNALYYKVFAALTVLTVITWWVAHFDLRVFNDLVALGIAATKASLVVLFFMHVRYASRLTKMVVVCAVLWLGIMLGLTLIDYVSRERAVEDPDPVPVPSSLVLGEHWLGARSGPSTAYAG